MIAQIYEIQTPEEAERCIGLGVDHIGSVILSEDEWRQPLIREVIGLSEGTAVSFISRRKGHFLSGIPSAVSPQGFQSADEIGRGDDLEQ